MQQLIILIVALALAGGVYLFLTISKKKSKEQTEENAVEMMTANEMINVKDIRNNCLHTNDGYTFTFIEIGGMSMELFSESEKLAYCKNITSIVSRFQFPYKYMAISSPYVIKHMVTADSNRLKNASGLCKQMLEDDINFATKMVIDDNKIDRRFFFMLFSKDEDEKTILKRTEDTINAFNSVVDGMSCELVKDKDIIKMYNLFTNPAYIAYERTDDVYLSMSQIIATNS